MHYYFVTHQFAARTQLSLKTKGFGNSAHGGLATGNQQYIAMCFSAFKLQATRRQACRDCPPTHPS
eukprot:6989046-Ditylum_brightwellii.AAC.1